MQEKFVSLIELEKKRNRTILLSSHIFREVDSCCDRIAIIKDGKIVSLFVADDLKHKTVKQYHLTYDFEAEKDSAKDTLKLQGFDVKDSTVNSKRLTVTVSDDEAQRFLKSIQKSHLVDFTEKKETLEDYFMSFYKEEKTYGGVAK